ncbi:hypothetical protein [Ekhidna sp.]|uniref:hypothetical protein n=1 Tax=Ekhidna sp. TaxID=2608089 RepID=UPI0032ED4B95
MEKFTLRLFNQSLQQTTAFSPAMYLLWIGINSHYGILNKKGEFVTEWKIGTEAGGRTECYATDYYYCTKRSGQPDDCEYSHTVITCRLVREMAGPEPEVDDFGGGGSPGGEMCQHPTIDGEWIECTNLCPEENGCIIPILILT